MPIPTDIAQGTNATPVEPSTWNALVDGINGNKDYYSAEVVFDVTHEDYGATGDGSTDDEPAIDLARIAATANGGVLFFPSGSANNTYKIGSNITFNSDVTLVFAPGATLDIQTGVTVTINRLAPTLSKIFTLTGTGVVTLTAGSIEAILPQWWGAVGDDATDNITALKAAITASANAGRIYLAAGTYRISTPLDNWPYDYPTNYKGIVFEGAGRGKTVVKYTGTSGFCLSFDNPDLETLAIAKSHSHFVVKDMQIEAPSLANASGVNTWEGGGILLAGASWSSFENLSIRNIGDGTLGTDVLMRRRHLVNTENSFSEDTNRDFGTTGGASNEAYAIKFTTEGFSGEQRLKQATVQLGTTGTPAGTVFAEIMTDSSGPSAVVYGTARSAGDTTNYSNTHTIDDITTDAGGETITFIWDGEYAPLVSGSTDYWVVLRTAGYTYTDTTTELRLRVEAAAGAANSFADYDASWNLGNDGADYVTRIGYLTPEYVTLRNVYSRDGSTRSWRGIQLEDDATMWMEDCMFQNAGTAVTLLGTSHFRASLSLFDTSGNYPCLNVTGKKVKSIWVGCYVEGANAPDYPSFFGRSSNPHLFVGMHMTNVTMEDGAHYNDFGSYIGYNVTTTEHLKTLDLSMIAVIHPDDIRISNINSPGFSVGTDGNAVYGRSMDIEDANNRGIRLNFRTRTTPEEYYIRLTKGVYMVTAWVKDTNQIADDFQLVSGYYLTGSPTEITNTLHTLTSTYEPYRILHIVDEDGHVTGGTYIDARKNTASSNDISISHITIERIGSDLLDRGDVNLWNPTAEDTDGGRESMINFWGRQSGEEQSFLARIRGSHDGSSDDEKGKLEILVNDTNDGSSPTLRTTWNADGSFNHGDGGATNYIQIAGDGFVTLKGAARATIDVKFSPSNVKVPPANFPTADTIGLTPVFKFDKAADKELNGAFEIPHAYVDGSDLKAHFHWAPVDADAGNVTWGIEWHTTTADNNEVLTEGTTTQIIIDATDSRQDEHMLTGDIIIDGTGIVKEMEFHFRIFRDADASEAGASDTYDDDASLIHFDVQVIVEGFGFDRQW